MDFNEQFRARRQPALTSLEYARAHNHFLRPVRDRGHDHDKECGDHDDDDDWDDHHGRGRDWHK